jgi:hypothetical protein
MKQDKTSNSNKTFPLRNMGVGRYFSLFGIASLLLVLETSMPQDPLRAPEKNSGRPWC